jgi:hypothetical protein
MKWLLILTAFFTFTAAAADITGNWKGTAETPNGTVERTFTFKVDGSKLTGETSSNLMGKSTIQDGKVEGDNVTFSIKVKFQENELELNYKGKVNGNEIKFTVAFPGGDPIEYTAKRV